MKALAAAFAVISLRLVCLIIGPTTSEAGTRLVTIPDDSGTGSLRDAIAGAMDGDSIVFTIPNGSTIVLQSGLVIDKGLTIAGYGPDRLTVTRSAAAADFAAFSITAGNFDVTIIGLTISNGESPFGGGIVNFNSGRLAITNCVISNNTIVAGQGKYGGGVSNINDGGVGITNCTITNNTATDSTRGGAGVGNNSSGTIIISNSTISNNNAVENPTGEGGGIANAGSGAIDVLDSTVSGNRAYVGGGIADAGPGFAPAGLVGMDGSTLSNNTASALGGAIYDRGQIFLKNSTVSDNIVSSASGGGGGIFVDGAMLSLANVTMSRNVAIGAGGGLYMNGGSTTLRSTIIAGNVGSNGGTGPPIPDIRSSGSLASQGYNLIGINSGATISAMTGDQIGTFGAPKDPRLGPLQNNGGPTQTRALLFQSPAIDGGEGNSLDINKDQRGFPRPVDLDNSIYPNAPTGDGSDIGAFEVQSLPASNCTEPPSNLTAWWTFDGHGRDIVGNNNLIFSGNPTFGAGEVGGAVSLISPSTFARANASSSLNVGAAFGFTIDAWIKPTDADIASQHPLFEWNDGTGNFGVHLWVSVTFGPAVGPGNLYAGFVDTNGVGGAGHVVSSVPNVVQPNVWQHVALTYDKNTGIGTLYLNGNIVAQRNIGVFQPQTSYDLYFGFRPSGAAAGARFTGQLDEAEIFNRRLSDAEIQAIYAAGSAGKCKPSQLLNISTRDRVLTGDNVLIGGFIITGTDPKKVLLRGIGPSLTNQGVPDALQDPILELFDSSGMLQADDNWKDAQQSEIEATTIPPTNDLESAIVRTLPANGSAYTAILLGKDQTTGVGLVEVYDLDRAANSRLANISTRGFVDLGDNVMIGGVIIGGGEPAKVVLRAIGPSLTSKGVANALEDPTLELHDASGAVIATNDNWQDDPNAGQVQAAGLAPTDLRESAIYLTMAPAAYTAIVRGAGNTTGVALVEAYNLQ
jgi:Concanavalin A-like lectin/glucanases superfamily